MSRDGRKPWETPIQYNDDRWIEPKSAEIMAANAVSHSATDNGEERDEKDIEAILRRPERVERDDYECNDVTPLNYDAGPHDKEFGVEDHDFDEPDNVPLNYASGPHEEEFGVEEDEELEPFDDDNEFPEM